MVVIIKLRATGKKLKPYLSSAPTAGKAQEKFKEKYGIPMGECVKLNVKKGMPIGEIHDAVRNCADKIKSGKMQKTLPEKEPAKE